MRSDEEIRADLDEWHRVMAGNREFGRDVVGVRNRLCVDTGDLLREVIALRGRRDDLSDVIRYDPQLVSNIEVANPFRGHDTDRHGGRATRTTTAAIVGVLIGVVVTLLFVLL